MKINNLMTATTTALVTTLCINYIAQAGTIRDDKNDLDYIDLATNYPSVGRLTIKYSNNEKKQTCSGTLITPGLVLTAAHCFELAYEVKEEGSTKKDYLDPNSGLFQIGNETYSLIGGVKKRQWKSSNRKLHLGFDIGLFALDRDVIGITPASLYTHSDPTESFQIGTYVGFGRTGTGLTGAIKPGGTSSDGKKRAGQNQIGQVGAFSKLLGSDFDNPRLANNPFYTDFFDSRATPLPYEYNIAKGDSGGGLFIGGFGNRLVSEPKLAGVISFLMGPDGKPDADYGDESYSVRVADYVSWIDNVINKLVLSTPTRVIPRGNSTDPFPVVAVADEVMWDAPGLFDNLYEMQLIEDIFVDNFDQITPTPSSEKVPEPSTLGTLLIGLSTLFGKRYMRQRRK